MKYALLWALLWGLTWAGRAHAEGADVLRPEQRLGAEATVTATAAPQTHAVRSAQVAPSLGLAWRVSRPLVLHADVGASFTSYRFGDAPSGSVARLANPLVGADVTVIDSSRQVDADERAGGPTFRLTLGGLVGGPLVTVPSGGITSSAAAEHADRVALAAAGPRGTFAWARNALPLVARARAAVGAGPLELRVDVEPGLLVSVNRDPSRAAFVVVPEAALVGDGYEARLGLATAISTSALEASRGGDFAQSAAFLGGRYHVGALYIVGEARLLLDGPQGVVEQAGTPWGVTFGIGFAR